MLQSCTPRWQTCIENTDDTLGFALGSLFVKATFDKKSKDIVSDGIFLPNERGDLVSGVVPVCPSFCHLSSCFCQAEEMINEIRSAFKEALDRLGWMDDTTRQAAKEKVDKRFGHMVKLVGQTEFQFVMEPLLTLSTGRCDL